jgi:hypothetical protein
MVPRIHVHIWSVYLLAILSGGGATAANVKTTHAGSGSECSLLLRNVQTELTRLGSNIVLAPLPESTAAHIYAEPSFDANGEDPLMQQLMSRTEWHRDAGFIHRLGHRGSNIGFRQKRSPSLHISVYPRGRTYIYEIHYDRFLALGRRPVAAFKHIFGEVIPNRFFGKHTSQEHINLLMQRRQGGELRVGSIE